MNHILDKYNVPVPRYTSYPPANFFHDGITAESYIEAVSASNDLLPSNLSFYIHFPYCEQLCHYCGCNSYLRTQSTDEALYFETLLKEMDLVISRIDPSRKISQIHFGGGSPSLADPAFLAKVIDKLSSRFSFIERPEIAIECHPGHLAEEGYEALLALGFTRISLGVQDFSTEVLRAVHRLEPLLPIEEVQEILQRHRVPLNLDFIYGLPLQTPESFEATIQRAIRLRPNRLVTFSYAHVPSMFPAQKLLEKIGLPTPEEKEEMYRRARRSLLESGYLQIGLDHFVLPTDELHDAAVEHRLHRNFQGYCTRRTTGQVYAFGVSAISQLTTMYAQNSKDIPTYLKVVNEGRLPVYRGYRLSPQEQVVREVITALMCNEQISWSDLAEHLQMTPEAVRHSTAYDRREMEQLQADGLIDLTEDGIRLASQGSPFLRYVASRLDPLHDKGGHTYSKPI
ncbi:MAG: oxygen-independent coproporphyrinogen III oxidase [Porphyromonas sp.]|nr:oxygen-independent coproporphyrinogen III oxidase [Porphyromonas sp.]